ncbi:MAG: hypothetical protein QOF76_4407 [Solirubrobacteraceae bacterium]|jgi:diguanylate cyclase (GGDEF)-like protein/PAS domain S-box-containing protein|nr:hypothetical protein [Solirubrobacteraceae bacterium]
MLASRRLAAEHFERFFALSSDLLLLADFDGRFLAVNDAWEHTLGWTRDTLMSQPFTDFLHPDDIEGTVSRMTVRQARGTEPFTNRWRSKDGVWRRIEWASEPIPAEGFIYASGRDVTDRYEAHQALERSEQRYRTLLDRLPNTVVAQTDRDLVVTFSGGDGQTGSRMSPASILGKHLSVLYQRFGPRAAELLELHIRALAGESSQLTVRSVLSGKHYEFRVAPLEDEGGGIDGTMMLGINVTAQVEAQRQTELLARLVDASGEAMVSTDLEGRIRAANPHACRLYGYSDTEIVELAMADLVAPEHAGVRQVIADATASGQPWRGELEHVTRSGRRVPVAETVSPVYDARGELVGRCVLARDISEAKAAKDQLEEANRRFQQTLTHAPTGMALIDLDGRLIEVNEALCRIVGYAPEELLTVRVSDVTHPDHHLTDRGAQSELLAGERSSYTVEERYLRKDGAEVWIVVTMSLVRDGDGAPLHFIGQMLDVTDRKRTELRLQLRADRDPLTGVTNRRRFDEILTVALASACRYRETSALLFVDLDRFKSINDTHGHRVGDQVLCAVASALQFRVRANDTIGRYGGDEFVVLLDRVDAVTVEALRQELAGVIAALEIRTASGVVRPTASIGSAVFDGLEATPAAVVDAADAAMYREKGRSLSAQQV